MENVGKTNISINLGFSSSRRRQSLLKRVKMLKVRIKRSKQSKYCDSDSQVALRALVSTKALLIWFGTDSEQSKRCADGDAMESEPVLPLGSLALNFSSIYLF